MASPSTVARTWPPAGAMHRPLPRPAAAPRVQWIARFVFWTLFLLSMTNAMGLFITYVRNVSDENFMLGIYPVTFAVCAVLVFAFTRGRRRSTILTAAWVFWFAFFLGGFLGSQQITATYFRATLEVTIKPWISIIGLPWLALRAISEDKVPRFLRATVWVAAIGAALGLLQLAIPGFLQEFRDESERATGFWVNPNSCGVMCALSLFVSLMCPFKRRWINWAARLLLIAGAVATFSRVTILILVLGWVVYGVATKQFRALLKSLIVLVLFLIGIMVTLEHFEASSPGQADRLRMVRAFLEGDWGADKTDNRTEVWKQTYLAIERKGGLLFGLGHGSMLRVVETPEGGVSPHNYYLYVLGNSGILALLALLAYEFVLVQQALKCDKREVRASLIAISAMIAADHMFDHSFIGFPFTGIIFACIVLGAGYGKPKGVASHRPLRPRYSVQPAVVGARKLPRGV